MKNNWKIRLMAALLCLIMVFSVSCASQTTPSPSTTELADALEELTALIDTNSDLDATTKAALEVKLSELQSLLDANTALDATAKATLETKTAELQGLINANIALNAATKADLEAAIAELEAAIAEAKFMTPVCPVYQNVDALPYTDPEAIKANLIAQLTAPVRWTQIVEKMIADGVTEFSELGPGNVLQGLVKKVSTEVVATSQSTL